MKLRLIGLAFASIMTALVTFGVPAALTRLYLSGHLSFLEGPCARVILIVMTWASIGLGVVSIWNAVLRRRKAAKNDTFSRRH